MDGTDQHWWVANYWLQRLYGHDIGWSVGHTTERVNAALIDNAHLHRHRADQLDDLLLHGQSAQRCWKFAGVRTAFGETSECSWGTQFTNGHYRDVGERCSTDVDNADLKWWIFGYFLRGVPLNDERERSELRDGDVLIEYV